MPSESTDIPANDTIVHFPTSLLFVKVARMQPPSNPTPIPEPSLVPLQGWHCNHFFYRWNRQALAQWSTQERTRAAQDWIHNLSIQDETRPQRFQTFLIAGHRADFGIVMMDPDPLKLDQVHQRILNSGLGAAIEPTYSFVSVSEVSEYLPTAEQYGAKLIANGEDPTAPTYAAKVASYARRLPMMLEHRLAPEFPAWPAMCFYPMGKSRVPGANWFEQPFSERTELMSEHAQSGMAFSGKVTQLVTSAFGLDDWEWGVTLWARNPQYLKEIVYTMRYDRASARYGLFGPFYVGYQATPQQIIEHCGIAALLNDNPAASL